MEQPEDQTNSIKVNSYDIIKSHPEIIRQGRLHTVVDMIKKGNYEGASDYEMKVINDYVNSSPSSQADLEA